MQAAEEAEDEERLTAMHQYVAAWDLKCSREPLCKHFIYQPIMPD